MAPIPEYLDSIGRVLGFAHRAAKALTTSLLAEYELSVAQWIVLSALWREDGLTITSISRYAKSTLPATSRLVGRMEDQGLVERQSRGDDRRAVRVWLTKRSRKMHGLLALYEELNAKLLEGFSEAERRRVRSYLQRIIANATRHYGAHKPDDPLVV